MSNKYNLHFYLYNEINVKYYIYNYIFRVNIILVTTKIWLRVIKLKIIICPNAILKYI